MTSSPFLIFDAYGTLVELDDFYGRLQRGFAGAGWHFSPDEIRRAAHREMKHYIDRSLLARDRESWLALRHECAGVLADALVEARRDFSLSVDKCTEILGDSIHFKAFPEARRVLEALHARGVEMGVLSNWDYELPRILESLDLKKYFAFVLSSAEVGAAKPSPRVFEKAWQMARTVRPQLRESECVYIGDHWEKDVEPARRAGWTPCWLVRARRDLPSKSANENCAAAPRVLTLRSLRPLLRLVQRKPSELMLNEA
jgi:putative hydrolase of the HAD superfamily